MLIKISKIIDVGVQESEIEGVRAAIKWLEEQNEENLIADMDFEVVD